MNPDIEAFKDPFNSCFQNLRVLFQFILNEHVLLEETIDQTEAIKKQTEKKGLNEEQRANWQTALEDFLGKYIKALPQLPWHQNVGIFIKLKRLLRHYPTKTSAEKKLVSQVYDNLHKARLECTRSYESVIGPKRKKQKPIEQSQLSSLRLVSRNLRSFIQSAIRQFSRDENIILFLLLKRNVLSRIYGKNYLPKLLPDLVLEYPQKRRLKEFLENRYKKRGFQTIANSIEQLVEHLQ